MSGLDGLTREELLALVLSLHERVQAQDGQIAELNAVVERQAERIAELEAEVSRLRGGGIVSSAEHKGECAQAR